MKVEKTKEELFIIIFLILKMTLIYFKCIYVFVRVCYAGASFLLPP